MYLENHANITNSHHQDLVFAVVSHSVIGKILKRLVVGLCGTLQPNGFNGIKAIPSCAQPPSKTPTERVLEFCALSDSMCACVLCICIHFFLQCGKSGHLVRYVIIIIISFNCLCLYIRECVKAIGDIFLCLFSFTACGKYNGCDNFHTFSETIS